ncbi:MAG: AsmA-like C-terminal region-containing protein [Alphaproteobacteria bacterium]
MLNLGRILTGLATIAAILVGAALGAPALMDWDHLRAPAEARAGALLGAPVRVDGRITVQLLPAPMLSLGDVVIEPARGFPVSGDFARARVHLALWPLLSGEAVPSALSFSGADLRLDRGALGRGAGLEKLPMPVTVKDGQVRLATGGGTAADVTGLSFSARAGRAGGRRVRLSGLFEETPFGARAALGTEAALRSAALNFGEGQAVLSLVRAETGGAADIRLKLTKGAKAAAFLGRVLPALGQVVRPDDVRHLGPLALNLRAVPEGGAFALQGVEITAGPLRLTGTGRYRPGGRPGLDLDLGARTLVLGEGERGFDPSGLLLVLGRMAEWGGRLDGGVRLHADHVLAGGAVLRKGEIGLRFGAEGTRLERFRVLLPRGLSLSGTGTAAGQGQLAAAVRLDGAHMRDLLNGPETGAPGVRAHDDPLTVEGRLVLSGARASLSDVRVAAGRNVLHAEGALFFGERTAVELTAEAEELDLRPYGLAAGDLAPEWSVDGVWKRVQELAARMDVTLRAEFGSLRLSDAAYRDGVFDLAIDRRQAVLRRLSVEEEGGRTVEARLRVPFTPQGADGPDKDKDAGWIARTEAAIDVRPADESGLAWRAELWDGTLNLETESPLRSRLSGRLRRKEEHVQWSDVTGRIGKAAVRATVRYLPGVRPVVRGIVKAESASIRLAGGAEGELWPERALTEFWPRGVDIHLDWSAGALDLAGAPLTGASGTVVLEKDVARLVLVSGALWGGAASGNAVLKRGAEGTVAWESQGVVQRVDLAALMGGGWRGRGTIRLSTAGSGTNIAEIVSRLRGTVGVNFGEGRIGGFDAAALAASLEKAEGANAMSAAAEQAFGSGATPFRKLEGEAKIRNGEVILSGISARAETGPVMLNGAVNLPARLIAAQADISLGQGVPLSVQFIGRLEAPERRVDTERLATRVGE